MKHFFLSLMILLLGLSVFSQNQYSRIRIDLQKTDLSEVAKMGIDVHEGILKQNYFFETDLSSDEVSKLQVAGIAHEVMIENVSKFYVERAKAEKNLKVVRGDDDEWTIPQNWEYGSMAGYYTLEEAYAEMDSMFILYPELISQRQAISEDTLTHEGRKLWWLKISNNPNIDEDEPEVLYTSVHHAREVISIQQQIFFMWYLLENYETDPEVKRIVDNTELYFVPVINPDGYQENVTEDPEGGGMWRKNKRNNGDGTYGVDPNRNYGFYWGLNDDGSSPWTSDETYRGPAAFSEPENKNMRDFCNAHEFMITLNYHSHGNYLLAPWGYTSQLPPDHGLLTFFGQYLTKENGYEYGPGNIVIYPTNGGSDDWMYGEQETKNKTFSWTPEIGNAIDGFWPQVSRIIPLCQEQMWQNMGAARLVNEYANLTNLSNVVTDEVENYAHFSIQRLGLMETEFFTVSIEALDEHIVETGDPIVYENMELLEMHTDSITYMLDAGIENGTIFKYLLKVDNGDFSNSDTITKIYGSEIIIFHDDCETLDNWSSNKWDHVDNVFYSPENSITDSPFSQYDDEENNTILLDTTINLAGVNIAFLRFWAMWDIEEGWDYVQLMAKDAEGGEWKALEGKLTSFGNTYLDPSDPVYDGKQSDWVQEEIDLSNYVGTSVNFKFRLVSDQYEIRDGFYFDEFTVSVISNITGIETPEIDEPNLFVSKAFPNPTSDAFSVQYNMLQNKGAELELFDPMGNLVQQIELTNTKGVAKIQFIELSSGVYFYRIKNGTDVSQTSRIVKL